MEIEDQQLVRRVLAGQTSDFRVLVERHQQAVFRFALGIIGNSEEAEEVAQEAFLAAFANLHGYDPSRAAFSTWLFTIARNRSINLIGRRRPTERLADDTHTACEAPDPIARRELSEQLDRALAQLPAEQRSAFVLAEIEQLPYAEIAEIEQTTLGTIKSRIHRAKLRLRSVLEPAMRESE